MPAFFKQPKIFGILNITTDSFSDAGKYLDKDKAVYHGQNLIENGADVIDIGAASSNPEAKPVTTELELSRLAYVVNNLKKKDYSLSIDTFNPDVQKEICSWDIDYINDIQGFSNPDTYKYLANSKCKLVLMFSIQDKGIATKENYKSSNIVWHIKKFFATRIRSLVDAGIESHRIILDPGMGFFLGSDPDMSIQVLKKLKSFKSDFDQELLISVSRKSFLGTITGLEIQNRDFITLATELWASCNSIDWIRTHDPLKLKSSFMIWEKLHSP